MYKYECMYNDICGRVGLKAWIPMYTCTWFTTDVQYLLCIHSCMTPIYSLCYILFCFTHTFICSHLWIGSISPVYLLFIRIVRNRAADKAKGSQPQGVPQQPTPPPGLPPSSTPVAMSSNGQPIGVGAYTIGNILGIAANAQLPAGTTIATDPNQNNIKRKHDDPEGKGDCPLDPLFTCCVQSSPWMRIQHVLWAWSLFLFMDSDIIRGYILDDLHIVSDIYTCICMYIYHCGE